MAYEASLVMPASRRSFSSLLQAVATPKAMRPGLARTALQQVEVQAEVPAEEAVAEPALSPVHPVFWRWQQQVSQVLRQRQHRRRRPTRSAVGRPRRRRRAWSV